MKTVKKMGTVKNTYSFQEYNEILDIPSIGFRHDLCSHGEYELVGHGIQTNFGCGQFKKFISMIIVSIFNKRNIKRISH